MHSFQHGPRARRKKPGTKVLGLCLILAFGISGLWAQGLGADRPGAGLEPMEASAKDHGRAVPAVAPALSEKADALYPSSLLQLPETVDSALVVDLEGNRLYIYQRQGGEPARFEDLYVSIGKQGPDKLREGDEKTPVGIYFSTRYLPGSGLPAIYGVGALPLDYPNIWDRRGGRTGSGIWIHGTDKVGDDLLPKSSRGCLALHNQNFSRVASEVDIDRTPVIIAKRLEWVAQSEVIQERQSFLDTLRAWEEAWESLDTEAYLSFYSQSFTTDGMGWDRFAAHKKRVGQSKTYIEIDLKAIGVYAYPGETDLIMATFVQDYKSNNFNRQKEKVQFWRQEPEGWRIVLESGRS